jgi:hypothetical protein
LYRLGDYELVSSKKLKKLKKVEEKLKKFCAGFLMWSWPP